MKRDHVRRLAFRLALACGRWDVDALLDEMTPRQWAQWQTFDRLEPIGEPRADRRHAMHLAHVLRFLAAACGGDPSAIEERQFLPYLHELHGAQAWEPTDADDRQTEMAIRMLGRQWTEE